MLKTPEAYAAAFEAERVNSYPVIDSLESRYGYAIDRGLLERMARVLACPVKKNPPNWQHGRLVYALAAHRLAQGAVGCFLDIGTAKGFSALCMLWAAYNEAFPVRIMSWDVIDPMSNEPRNSVFDGQAQRGVSDYMFPFMPDAGFEMPITLAAVGDAEHRDFSASELQIGFAFVDGAHTFDGVKADIELIVPRQKDGDIILFDDFHLRPVADAVLATLPEEYVVERVTLKESREYAIAVRAEI